MESKLGILITAYNNVKQTLQNIKHIREILKCPIAVVSTAYEPKIVEGFHQLNYVEGVQPLAVKVLEDAPGNPESTWEPPEQHYISWRHKYIPPRILKSLDVGCDLLWDMKVSFVLHIHSDTFINHEWKDELLKEVENLSSTSSCGYWDLCVEDSLGPENSHPHPEGILLDLCFCKMAEIVPFSRCYEDENFVHWNWGSTESLIANWIHYKTTGNMLTPASKSDRIYLDSFIVRMKRDYHGNWYHLMNLKGTQ